jgi:hypothetical protein
MTLNRRRLCGAIAALALAPPAIARADAPPPPPWAAIDGAWIGEKDGVKAYVLVYIGQVLAFRWRDASAPPSNSKPSPDDRAITFDFPGGHATLTVTGPNPKTARITIVDTKGEVSLDLHRD